ncbi:transglutaminase-like domain-containing protein, partial [Dolichospermum sp. ST_sed4]|nr:transglutaminase-like domain-containing protein [Dolichospermum sp. ST_sed4]
GNEFNKYYLQQKSAIDTLLDKKGVCDEFANMAAAMLRAKKIPTRIVMGITYDGQIWGNHAWIEVYHQPKGWIPSDPTFREAGFVDATHIKIASFDDVTKSNAK